ncbi:hypothetical protein [Caldimonas sp. KR1-144]|uniref:hypothetical protein n=1 Tax=Caldimonas sp. KR1-144 TaxID=3400911 RepID=UPI003C05792E
MNQDLKFALMAAGAVGAFALLSALPEADATAVAQAQPRDPAASSWPDTGPPHGEDRRDAGGRRELWLQRNEP